MSGRDDSTNDVPSSRGSSRSRRSLLRSATSRSTTDQKESSSSSTWLKRLSSFSSHSTTGSPAPSVKFQDQEDAGLPPVFGKRPSTSIGAIPNKLVKRSVSQRGLSHDEATGQILRRPATSHHRSQTFRDILSRPISNSSTQQASSISSTVATSPLIEDHKRSWRPFFETGFPRKRRRSEAATDAGQIRVISLPLIHKPIMLLGSHLDDVGPPSDIDERPELQPQPQHENTSSVRRPRRSLSSLRRMTRKRNFTDPSVQLTTAAVCGTISPVKNYGQLSPIANGSAFHIQLPPGTPHFTSSPPLPSYDNRDLFQSQRSVTASDPPTIGSDVDGRVFSDSDSMDFRSDTAYDSVATRATSNSHLGLRDSKLETIFAARTSDEIGAETQLWRNLNQKDTPDEEMHDSPFPSHDADMHGIGITMTNGKQSSTISRDDISMATPPRSASIHTEDLSVTPVPVKSLKADLNSSPPFFPSRQQAQDYDQVGKMLEDMRLDEDEEPNWSGDEDFERHDMPEPGQIMSFPGLAAQHLIAQFQESDDDEELSNGMANGNSYKPSIFDWSEHQQVTNLSRPKTVHGKQDKSDRSRSSGRKGAPQLHFRSQSVPINRDGPVEDLPTTTKFPTWKLGHKPVSEEWSDDFEFDDAENTHVALPAVDENSSNFRDSVRSVRIPQSIIDRQQSVHLQFGQVQEFMALVEELKRLKSRGNALHILHGNASTLWEDAESIINLATINDEDQPTVAVSPPSSDPFAELPAVTPTIAPNAVQAARGRRPTTTGRRSVSAMTTPPIHGRARGESLAQARHFLQTIHQTRDGIDWSPQDAEIHHQKKLPFDTQDLKDLVVRSGVITRALKEEVRRAEGVSISPHKTPPGNKLEHPLSEIFRVPEEHHSSPCPPFRKPGLPKSRSAHSYLESGGTRQYSGPFSSPIPLAAVV